MSKASNKATASKPEAQPPRAARPENSKVVREEITYTTMKATHGFLFMGTKFKTVNNRQEVEKASIFVELKRGIEFFPSKFLANYRGAGWAPGEAMAHLDALRTDLARRASPTGEIREWTNRPRPQSQIELENELRNAYKDIDSAFSTIDSHAATIEALRAQLVAAGQQPQG